MKFPAKQINTVTGAYLLRQAVRLAIEADRIGVPSKARVIDGYMLRGSSVSGVLRAQVLDSPGVVLFPDTTDREVGDGRQVDLRDYYNSTLSIPAHPSLPSAEGRSSVVYLLANVGFPQSIDAETPPSEQQEYTRWITSQPWGYARAYEDRWTNVSHHSLFSPSGVYGSRDYDCVFTDAVTYWGAKGYKAGGVPFVFKDTSISELTGGYLPVVKSQYIYVSQEYQGYPAFSARVQTSGTYGSLLVMPVVKRGATPEVLDWGDTALWFAVVDIFEGDLRVLHNQLWKPDDHSVDFFHQGPLLSKPINGYTTSPLGAAQAALDAYWGAWTSGPSGKRPSWIDCLVGTQVGDTVEVSARLCACNGDYLISSPPEPEPPYWMGSGHARMRFVLSRTAPDTFSLGVTEVDHEIYESPTAYTLPYVSSPYTRWVVGALNTTTVTCRHTVVMRRVGARIVEVDLTVAGPRNGPSANFVGYTDGSEAFVFKVRTPDAADATYTTPFTTLGAGIQMPVGTFTLTADKYLAAPGSSYKLWTMDQMFVELSDTELAFVASTYWDDGDNSTVDRPAVLCVFNTVTGVASIRSTLPAGGFAKQYRVTHRRAPSLSCVQRTTRDELGATVYEGVLLCHTQDGFGEVYISRDSGQTWQTYIDGAPTFNGALYVGNPLTSGLPTGQLISGA